MTGCKIAKRLVDNDSCRLSPVVARAQIASDIHVRKSSKKKLDKFKACDFLVVCLTKLQGSKVAT